ncbi:MAG: hypothetical protein A2Z20_04620 [Bdellovibrionales bacterium RBG_16_40_8]|nr:MAG: hypothetical protein A2Z20_04620 [Bdellovibrionales bacterium RBG_16_40_8]
MKKLLIFFVSGIIFFGLTIFFRLGGYKSVDIKYTTYPELYLLYKDHFGPYHKIAEAITEVETWATAQNLPCRRTFGEYLDNPRITEERRLRSYAGCVLDQPFADSSPFQYKKINSQKFVIASFLGAPSLGPFKVYPKVEKYINEKKLIISGPPIEVYLIKSNNEAMTEYLFPVKE